METEAKKKKQVWITTVDNPFDPFTQFDRWYRYDESQGYHTCGTLAMLANTASNLFDCELDEAIDFAISRLIEFYSPNQFYQLAIEGQTQKFGLYSD